MSTLTSLRARPGVITLGADAPDAITVRVQLLEAWDTVTVRCAKDIAVLALKRAALEAFEQYQHPAAEYVMKLRGFEVLDESVPVTVAGAREGSTFLLTYRFRRPVR